MNFFYVQNIDSDSLPQMQLLSFFSPLLKGNFVKNISKIVDNSVEIRYNVCILKIININLGD